MITGPLGIVVNIVVDPALATWNRATHLVACSTTHFAAVHDMYQSASLKNLMIFGFDARNVEMDAASALDPAVLVPGIASNCLTFAVFGFIVVL
jgi:hypothetical protein